MYIFSVQKYRCMLAGVCFEAALLPLLYDGTNLEIGVRLDILVEEKVIIEIKSVVDLCKLHFKQLLTYLKLSQKKVGILFNFNCENITENIKRIVNDF